MGRNKDYQNGYRGKLLSLVLENGFLPLDCLRLYDYDTMKEMQRYTRILKSEEIVREQRTLSGTRYIRLSEHGEGMILGEANAELVSRYKSDRIMANLRYLAIEGGDKEKKVQYKQQQNKIVNDVCAKLFAKISGVETRNIPELDKHSLSAGTKAFFDSSTVKSAGTFKAAFEGAGSQKLSNSRINGLSVTPGGVYSIYSTGKSVLEWKRSGEVKMAACIQALMNKTTRDFSMADYEKEAVIISSKDGNFTKIMEAEYKKNSHRRILMNIDFTYEHMYSIPFSNDGVRIFRMMQMENWKYKILDQILEHDEIQESNYVSVSCDGYDKANGIYKLIYCIPDMTKLKGFAKRAAIEGDKERYQIYCYKSQVPIIAPLVKDNAKVFIIGIDDMEREIGGSDNPSSDIAI